LIEEYRRNSLQIRASLKTNARKYLIYIESEAVARYVHCWKRGADEQEVSSLSPTHRRIQMIKKLKALLAGAALASLCTAASAGYYATSFSDYIDVSPDIKLSAGQSVSWTHTLMGFRPLQDIIDSFSVSVGLRDDAGCDFCSDRFEFAALSLPSIIPGGDTEVWEVNDTVYTNNGNALLGFLQLNAFGTLDVTLKSISGDFYFTESTLKAKGYAVPEPGMLALLGLGLAGMALVRRRRETK
jgi:hypothetical protein